MNKKTVRLVILIALFVAFIPWQTAAAGPGSANTSAGTSLLSTATRVPPTPAHPTAMLTPVGNTGGIVQTATSTPAHAGTPLDLAPTRTDTPLLPTSTPLPPTPTPVPVPAAVSGLLLGLGTGAVLLVIALVLLVGFRRRKK